MKNLSSLILLIVFILYTSSKAQWEVLNDGFEDQVNTIDFINSDTGWLIGEETLLMTKNGGENWDIITLPNEIHIFHIDFYSDSLGWAMGIEEGNDRSSIFKTTDGGQSWNLQKEFGAHYSLESFSVVNDTVVYAVGIITDTEYCSGWVMKTTDGGINWEDITPYAPITYIDLTSIHFITESIGFVSGSCDNSEPVLFTVNGGDTWDELNLNELDDIYDIQSHTDSSIYFCASQSIDDADNYYFCVTSDTFNTWSVLTERDYPIQAYNIINNSIFFAIMEDSNSTYLMKSTDGGLNWQLKDSLEWGGDKIYFKDADVGFVISNSYFGSALWKSIDQGNNWVMENIGYPFQDVYFINEKEGFACGGVRGGGGRRHGGGINTGDLLFTTDGGKTWERQTEQNFSQLDVCFFINDHVGFLLGNRKSYKTKNFRNWSELFYNNPDSSGFDFWINDLYFLNEETGWVVGRSEWLDGSCGAGIFGTNDGGENWDLVWEKRSTDEFYFELNAIYVNGSTVWAVGESGLIVTKTDQGLWRSITGVTDLPLYRVFFRDEDHGWISGGYFDEDNEYLILLKTTDGGEIWQNVPDINYEIKDMYFRNNFEGWAIGSNTIDDGILLATLDGGISWGKQTADLPTPLNAIYFVDNTGWAVGENGLILKTEDGGISWIDEQNNKVYPTKYKLSQNFPNPFNPLTAIGYQLSAVSDVELSVYNLLGQKVTTLVNERQRAGYHQVEWDASGFASGIYYYRIETGEFQDVKKMILIK